MTSIQAHHRLLVLLVHDVEAFPILQSLPALSFVHIDAPDVRQKLDSLPGDVGTGPPAVGQWEKRVLVHLLDHVVPAILGLPGWFDGLCTCFLEFLNRRRDKVALHLDDGWAVGECGGRYKRLTLGQRQDLLNITQWDVGSLTVRCVDHEAVGEAVDRHAQVRSNPVFPDVFDVKSILALEAHLRQSLQQVRQL